MPVTRRAVLATLATAAVLPIATRTAAEAPIWSFPTLANDPIAPGFFPQSQSVAAVSSGLPEAGLPSGPTPPELAAAPLDGLPAWRRHAVAVNFADPRPKIAVMIDDLGVMHLYTQRAVALP